MSLDRCPICGEFLIWSNHTCQPSFFVFSDPDSIYWDIKTGSLSRKHFARDAGEAVIKYCDNDFETPDELDVWVISTKEWDEVAEFDVENESQEEFDSLVKSRFRKFTVDSEVRREFHASEYKEIK